MSPRWTSGDPTIKHIRTSKERLLSEIALIVSTCKLALAESHKEKKLKSSGDGFFLSNVAGELIAIYFHVVGWRNSLTRFLEQIVFPVSNVAAGRNLWRKVSQLSLETVTISEAEAGRTQNSHLRSVWLVAGMSFNFLPHKRDLPTCNPYECYFQMDKCEHTNSKNIIYYKHQ